MNSKVFVTHCRWCGKAVRTMTDKEYIAHFDGKCPQRKIEDPQG